MSDDSFLQLVSDDFRFERGHPLPFGATVRRGGVNFAIFSGHATAVTLVLYLPGSREPMVEFPLDPRYNRTGNVWHAFIAGLDPGIEYGYRMDGPSNSAEGHRFQPQTVLLDPYAKALSGGEYWGVRPRSGYRSLVVDDDFDWGMDQPLNIPLADSVIYELHVRGYTRHPSSGVAQPGTFAGLMEKIPYLKQLGVTAVELLPVAEFDENDNPHRNPETGERLYNFWGYHPISFFAPKAAYVAHAGNQVREFKAMVKAFHQAGIEVILDVVYNHTGEGDERGPTLSFRGIDNSVYYMLEPGTGAYCNFSGCGNTVNCNHPVVRGMVMDCLRYWVTEMHVDGFRFDLASILGRGRDGEVLANPPLLERIATDPVLANTKIIAEAWDAAGLYQVGSFPAWGRWAEWNGKFRDDVRRFVRGEPGMVPHLATRLAGSSDLYQTSQREPFHSINFITSHDGFTLADLVAYNEKHNEANGEGNRDGENDNHSWNCGAEGPTDDPRIHALRRRQMRNFLTLLLMARGVPMLLAGDELGRSQQGNNNAYCQDNELSWVDWGALESEKDLLHFVRCLVSFRKVHRLLREGGFVPANGIGPHIRWHGSRLDHPDWSWDSRSLGMYLYGYGSEGCRDDIYIIANADPMGVDYDLPPLEDGRWHRFVDTALDDDQAAIEPGREPVLPDQRRYPVQGRSVVVLVGR
jgi:glycogen operon protein